MSIHDTLHKIKRGLWAGNFIFIYLFIIVGVGFSSFLLGRLSISGNNTVKDEGISITEVKSSQSFAKSGAKIQSTNSSPIISGEGKYVASKNGKLYYTATCKGANRIKAENRVWFDTAEDAQKQGYTWATSCK